MNRRPALGAMALHLGRQDWAVSQPTNSEDFNTVSWRGNGLYDVPIYVTKCGFLVFDFPESESFRGGADPDEPEGTLIAPNIRIGPVRKLSFETDRAILLYKRLSYMSSTRFAIGAAYSCLGIGPVEYSAPTDPHNYHLATQNGDQWLTTPLTFQSIKLPNSESGIIPPSVFNDALEIVRLFERALGIGGVELLRLTHLAMHQHYSHQFASAHTLCWSIAEAVLNHLWVRLQSETGKSATTLLDGKRDNIAEITTVLYENGVLIGDSKSLLDQTRRVRNRFSHRLEPVSSSESTQALLTLSSTIGMVINRNVWVSNEFAGFF